MLVDASPLFMRDAANVEGRLRALNQGAFRFDAGRSGFYPARMKAFPQNTEIETIATFAADNPGLLVNNVTPDGRAFTLRIHHSFLKAPEGYRPRLADPRIGVSALTFRDYAKPFNEGTEVGWVTRWRLEKVNPGAAMSEPKTPIVFYLDPGIPEPVRTAMREGTLWWNKAFEAAGYRNAVQVKDPTPDMDPMDIRYAWILWINRDERGFSSGGTYRDPRTGEILGSKTRMDSHRIRTIGNYWESYTPTDAGADCAMFLPVPDYLLEMAAQPRAMPDAERDMVLLQAEPPHRARAGARARLRPQLGLEPQQSRVGDGVSDAAGQGRRKPARSERVVSIVHRRVRRVDGALRVHRVLARARKGGTGGHHPGHARERHPVRSIDGSALVVVRRSRHAQRVPARDDGGAEDHARSVWSGHSRTG